MRYISTRGQAPVRDFAGVLLAGLAEDGGLYVPEAWPLLGPADWRALRGLPYPALAARLLQSFVGTAIAPETVAAICHDAYAGFGHPAVVPLIQLDTNLFVQELFHGPTLAFKDMAMSVLGRLFDHVLARRGERVTIVGATSGDTGSAAIAACRDRDSVDIFILHPRGRVSDVQRRQMTTVFSANVHNVAIDGTFDDCQDLVKAMFNDAAFRDAMRLSAVNSINWARIMAQTVYYFAAGLALGAPDRPIAFSVPTGNFGDVFAGYVAHRMGLPVAQLVIATNTNDILARFFATGEMSTRPVTPTLSPAMDIQLSSNFERLLFDMLDRDGRTVSQLMQGFRASGTMHVSKAALDEARRLFDAARLDDDGTRATIRDVLAETGALIDPHSAVGVQAGRACRRDKAVPLVTLSTAHPAKFPEAVEQATGVRPALPARLAGLLEKPERFEVLPNDIGRVMDFVRAHARSVEVA